MSKKSPTKVHKIKAKTTPKTISQNITKTNKTTAEPKQPTKKTQNPIKKILIPIVKLNRYFRQSYLELKKVRWPNRKETWQKVLSVIIYGLVFIVLVVALDNLFNWLFKLMLGV